MTPRVTVLMPVYNGEKYLAQALESILNQTYQDFEFLIINDGSSDRSEEIIRSYRDSRIRLVNNPENLKLIATLNKGLGLARGEYLARMDCDDISRPERLALQVQFLDAHPDVGVCGSWVQAFGEAKPEVWRYPSGSAEIEALLFFQNTFAHPAVMLRRSKLEEFGLAYDPGDIHVEDYGLWLRCSRRFPLANIPQVLLDYRILPTSLSHAHMEVTLESLRRLHRESLAHLGIEPSAENLAAHWEVVSYYYRNTYSREYLLRAEQWLQKLVKTNAALLSCPEPAFNQAVRRHWFAICTTASSLGPRVLAAYFNSTLRLPWDTGQLKFILKCLIRRGKANRLRE